MKIELIVVGKTADARLSALIDDYLSRIAHYSSFEMITVPERRNTKSISREQQKRDEGAAVLRRLQQSDSVVLLDEHGTEMSSTELARYIEKLQSTARRLVFVVGGPYGFCDEMHARADDKLSLSRLTFSHQMVRLIFVEQLYRAFTIIKGEPYHHE